MMIGQLRAQIASLVDDGYPGVQLALARGGSLLHAESFGDAKDCDRFVLQSCGRSVLAAVAWRLVSDHDLDLLRPVADYIPEFGSNGKDAVTVEQVLTHVGGFPLAPLGFPAMLSRQSRLEAFAKWRLTYVPGTRLEFHLTSAAWVIGELTERLTGLTYRDHVRRSISEPLGLHSLDVAVPVEEQRDVAPFALVGPPNADGGVDPWGPWYLSRPEILAAGEPSHSAVSTAADLAMLFQGIAHSGLWKPSLVADATRIRVRFPIEGLRGDTASVPANIALFVHVAGDDGLSRGFLPRTGSARTWGHGGAACQLAFYDPETDLSVALLTNGYPATGYALDEQSLPVTQGIADSAAALAHPGGPLHTSFTT
jgi:CubicO group peptidase (beta-lactamase class C family)